MLCADGWIRQDFVQTDSVEHDNVPRPTATTAHPAERRKGWQSTRIPRHAPFEPSAVSSLWLLTGHRPTCGQCEFASLCRPYGDHSPPPCNPCRLSLLWTDGRERRSTGTTGWSLWRGRCATTSPAGWWSPPSARSSLSASPPKRPSLSCVSVRLCLCFFSF